jgi:hypothetical protein
VGPWRASSQPANQPSSQPAGQPASQPANQPTSQPATQPANQPTSTCAALHAESITGGRSTSGIWKLRPKRFAIGSSQGFSNVRSTPCRGAQGGCAGLQRPRFSHRPCGFPGSWPCHLIFSILVTCHMSHLRIWRSPHPHLKLPFPQTPDTDDTATVCFGTKYRGELFAVVLVKDCGYVVWCLQHPKTSGASEPGYHQWLQYLCRRARYRYHAPGDGQVVAASSVGQAREEQCRIQ